MQETEHIENIQNVIIGAGITGLTRAWALTEKGESVCVLEKAQQPGGAIRTVQKLGYLIEEGPNTLQINSAALQKFLTQLGLASELLDANPQANTRFIVKGGKLRAAPMGLGSFARTPLLGMGGKLRLCAEPFIKKGTNPNETLAAFITRRLGPAALNDLIDPFVSGIYAGSPANLSVRLAFPKLWGMEQNHGSLIRAGLAHIKARKQSGAAPRFKTRLVSFKNGLQTLPNTLAQRIQRAPGSSVHLGAHITDICYKGEGGGETHPWAITYTRADEPDTSRTLRAATLTLCVPAWALANLPLPAALRAQLQPLESLPTPAVSSLTLAYPAHKFSKPGNLQGFGFLAPSAAQLPLLGTLYNSTLFEGRAPAGMVSLTSFLGGTRSPAVAELSIDAQTRHAATVFENLLGLQPGTPPSFVHHRQWPRAIPQYTVGYQETYTAHMAQAETTYRGLRIVNNARSDIAGIALGKCIAAGLAV